MLSVEAEINPWPDKKLLLASDLRDAVWLCLVLKLTLKSIFAF